MYGFSISARIRTFWLVLITICHFGIGYGQVVLSTTGPDAAFVNQGTNDVVLYNMTVTNNTEANVTINQVKFRLSGSYLTTDLTNISVYISNTSDYASLSYIGGTGTIQAPDALFTLGTSAVTVPAGEARYLRIRVNVSISAVDGHTVHLNGANDYGVPGNNGVMFNYTTSPTVTNGQTNQAKAITFQNSKVSISSSVVSELTVNQGTVNIVAYDFAVQAAQQPVTVNQVKFRLSGSYLTTDLTNISVYVSNTSDYASLSYIGGTGTIQAPDALFTLGTSAVTVPAGETRYFRIRVNVSTSAVDGHTVHLNGANDYGVPGNNGVMFSYTTEPTVTNGQTNKAGAITFQNSKVSISSSVVSELTVNQGTVNIVAYDFAVQAAQQPVTINQVKFRLSGSYLTTDLTNISVYVSNTSDYASLSYIGGTGTIQAPDALFTLGTSAVTVPAGETRYFRIRVNVSTSAVDGHTVHLNGANDYGVPGNNGVVFSYTTSPTVTNGQTNKAGVITIKAADLTLSTVATPAFDMTPGSTNNVLYVLKLESASAPLTMNQVRFTLTGTYVPGDLTNINVQYSTQPDFSSPTILVNSSTIQPPGTEFVFGTTTVNIPQNQTAYIRVRINLNAAVATGSTIQLNGATHPVIPGFTTSPIIINNQANDAPGGTLPLSLVHFGGKPEGTRIVLEWNTADEYMHRQFGVLHSVDAIHFNVIGVLKGNTSGVKQNNRYRFIDEQPQSGINYYRLQMIAIDGQSEYSAIISVKSTENRPLMTVYPNPAHSHVSVRVSLSTEAPLQLRLFDLSGKQVMQREERGHTGSSVLNLPLNGITAGIYILELKTPSGTKTQRLVVGR